MTGDQAGASSSRAPASVRGGWKSCMVSQGQLDRLSHAGYVLPQEVAYARPVLIAIGEDTVQESIPIPQENELVCFAPSLFKV